MISHADSLGDPTLGIVFSGGGAFGAAHVGVLHALAERGIHPGIVTGTSSGALIGAAYAAGVPLADIDRGVRAFRWSQIAGWTWRPRAGLLDSHRLTAAIIRTLGHDPLIETLPRRFAAVSVDARRWRLTRLDAGPLSIALRATIAVPVLIPPVIEQGRILTDGGMIDNVPHRTARTLGARRVIIVRLHARWESVRMMRSQAESDAELSDPTNLHVLPDMGHLAQWSLRDVPRLIDVGRAATDAALAMHTSPGMFRTVLP